MSACRSCHAEIEWAVTDRTGVAIPLDLGTTPDGNIVPIGIGVRGARLVHVFGPDDLVVARIHGRLNLYRSHFASCPNAADWRRSNRTKGEK